LTGASDSWVVALNYSLVSWPIWGVRVLDYLACSVGTSKDRRRGAPCLGYTNLTVGLFRDRRAWVVRGVEGGSFSLFTTLGVWGEPTQGAHACASVGGWLARADEII